MSTLPANVASASRRPPVVRRFTACSPIRGLERRAPKQFTYRWAVRSDSRMTRGPEFPGYDSEAEFYDLCWSSLAEDIEFYKKRIGGPGRLLDLMCGTGRVTLAFARAGWTVVGIDESEGMLRLARSKLGAAPEQVRRRVRFLQSDLTGFRAPGLFGAALIPVNSFPLILSRRARLQSLRNVHRHLARSGKLLMQVDTPRSYESARVGAPLVSVHRLDRGRRWYVRSLSERFIRSDIVRGITKHLIVDRFGRVQRGATTETRTRVLPLAEVVRELREAGFSDSPPFGDYSGRRLRSNSSFAVIEAAA